MKRESDSEKRGKLMNEMPEVRIDYTGADGAIDVERAMREAEAMERKKLQASAEEPGASD